MLSIADSDKEVLEGENKVIEQQNVADMFGSVGKNDLTSFKKHLESNANKVNKMVSLIKYTYSVSPMIFTKNNSGEIIQLNPNNFISSLMGGTSSMMPASGMSVFSELLDNDDMLLEQFTIIEGKLPERYDEVILILPEENKISDLLLYFLGLRDFDELQDMISKMMSGEKVINQNKPLQFTYDELMNLEFKLLDATSTYKYNSKYNIYESMLENVDYMNDIYNSGIKLKIVGIVTPKDNALSMSSGIGYTRDLTEYVIKTAEKSEIVKKQLADKNVNVFSGKNFDDKDNEMGLNFQDMISIDEEMLSSAFGTPINQMEIENMTKGYIDEISKAITVDNKVAKDLFLNNLSIIMKNILNDYYLNNQVGSIASLKLTDIPDIVSNGLLMDTNRAILVSMENQYVIPQATFESMYNQMITNLLQQYVLMIGGNNNNPPVGGEVIPSNDEENIPLEEDSVVNDNTQTKEDQNFELPEGGVDLSAPIVGDGIDTIVSTLTSQDAVIATTNEIANAMTEAIMQKTILTKVGSLTQELISKMAASFKVDESKIAAAFKFDMTEEEMRRLFETLTSTTVENADTNLLSLGYQDLEKPTSISFYFKDFDSKEDFIDFLDGYNENVDDEKVISYTDLTGILMSSVKTIVDSVSYVLIAFVSISLIVSSIMIGIITYISVLERTKEIGVLRAIGASKANISSIFNAETFIVGLFSGLIGILVTIILLIPINIIIHSINSNITAVLPIQGAIVLVILSVILTLIGGLIPSRQASKKDPVLALRSE